VRGKPYFVVIARGIRLAYRRNRGPGTWSVEGGGGAWLDRFAHADDYEGSDNEHVLDFWQAQDKARKLARGNGDNAPATVATALDDYATDLKARDGNVNNVGRVRSHLTSTLAGKPVGLLTAVELRRWRDGLLAKGLKPASAARTCRILAAALTLASKHDHRIVNNSAWRTGLGGLVDTHNPRNAVLTDDEILALIAAARAIDSSFADYLEVHAVTGARSSQIAQLLVADLQADRLRLMMPSSAKGRGRRRGVRVPVPITAALAAKLQAIANGRPPSEPLLKRSDGKPWHPEHGDHSRLFARAAERAGLKGHTIYSLRHSSIVRSLLAGVPLRVTAVVHNTSAGQIESTYSRFIADHADEVARRGLLDTASPLTEQL
jgi:integrase